MRSKVECCKAKARECQRRAETAADRGVKRAYWRVAAQWSDMASKTRRAGGRRAVEGACKIRSSGPAEAIVRNAFRAQRSKPPPPPLARCARSGGPPPPLCALRFAGEDKRAFSIFEQ